VNTPLARLLVERSNWGSGLEVLLTKRVADRVQVCSITWAGAPDEGLAVEPSFRLSLDDAQSLMDQLWTCGLRPSEGSGSAGALAATQKHLDDVRKLLFEDPRFKP
jgi:hypothetical protein